MTRGRKLSDADVQAIRERRADGEPAAALAREFVSRQHISRLARGESRPVLDKPAEGAPSPVLASLLGLLDGLELEPGERVIAGGEGDGGEDRRDEPERGAHGSGGSPAAGAQLLELLRALPHGRDRIDEIMEPLQRARSRKGANGR